MRSFPSLYIVKTEVYVFCQFHGQKRQFKGDMFNVKLIICSLHEIEKWVNEKTVTV